jgi:hypothetical protein
VVFQYRADDAFQLYSHVFADTGWKVRGERHDRMRFESFAMQLPQPTDVDPGPASVYFQVGSKAQGWNLGRD